MKKNLLGSLLLVASIASLASCQTVKPTINDDGALKIVMITDKGTIDDKNFNQGTWEGIKAWGEANGLKDANDTKEGNTYQYIKPTEGTTAEYTKSIETAYQAKADIIICPGYLFQEAFEEVANVYPSITFIGLDFEINDLANTKNVINISYKEQESGFMAGYGAVANGQTSLGFVGGMFGPAVERYGIGYVAGAAYANKVLGKSAKFIKDHYWYSGTFNPDQNVYTKAKAWYTATENPTDVIFACAGGAGNSVFTATKETQKYAIGVDVDQGLQPENTYLLTSAIKGLATSVQDTLDKIVNSDKTGTKEDLAGIGGTHLNLGASDNATGLPTNGKVTVNGKEESTWRFTNWTIEEYNTLFAQIKDGSIVVPTDASKDELKNFINDKGTLADFNDDFLNYIYTGK